MGEETEVYCLKKEMLFVNHETPDGSKRRNCLWNGGNGWGTVKLYLDGNCWRK